MYNSSLPPPPQKKNAGWSLTLTELIWKNWTWDHGTLWPYHVLMQRSSSIRSTRTNMSDCAVTFPSSSSSWRKTRCLKLLIIFSKYWTACYLLRSEHQSVTKNCTFQQLWRGGEEKKNVVLSVSIIFYWCNNWFSRNSIKVSFLHEVEIYEANGVCARAHACTEYSLAFQFSPRIFQTAKYFAIVSHNGVP